MTSYIFAVKQSDLAALSPGVFGLCSMAYALCIAAEGEKKLTARYVDAEGAVWLVGCAWESQMAVPWETYATMCEQFLSVCPSIKYAVTYDPVATLEMWGLKTEGAGEI